MSLGITKSELASSQNFGGFTEDMWDALFPVHGVKLIYRQRGVDFEGQALRGIHRSFVQDSAGSSIMTFDNDFLFKRRKILFPEMPIQGDEIRVTDADFGLVRVYRVGLLNGDRPWRWSDSFERVLRVHTVQSHTEAMP